MKTLRAVPLFILCGVLLGCPPPRDGKGPRGGGAGVDPDACGDISTSKVGRKLYSFLVASAELDKASLELETSVKKACQKMARELGISDAGDTRTVCKAAAAELEANLEISVKTEKQLVTRYTPAECTTDVDFTASVVAECEASVAADVNMTCEGSCGGTCSGTCDGTCQGGGAGGECNGVCEGTCRGKCSADCHGYVDVDASVECEASAEVRASVNTTCTEPKVEVVEEDVTIVDATKFDAAMRAIDAGMPAILRAAAKAELVLKASAQWVKTLGGLVKASGELVEQIGDKGLCVGAQLAASFAAAAQIEARVSVSIEVSAEVSASAGAQAQ
jgi:hypothetical protein